MAWEKADVLAAYNAISPAPPSDQAAADTLNAQTVTTTVNTDGASARGLLYTRAPIDASGNPNGPSSLERVAGMESGQTAASSITPATGYSVQQVITLCDTFYKILTNGDPIQMTLSGVNAKIQADLDVLMASKLSDGKGILWAPGELSSADPGDKAVMLGKLVNLTSPKWSPALSALDIASITGK